MWPFKKRKADDSLAATLSQLQKNLVGKDKDPGFLIRLSKSMDACPEPYEWIFMVLRERLAKLEQSPRGDAYAIAIRQAELRAEVRLLRSLSMMAFQAKDALDHQQAMSQEALEAAESASY